MNLLRNKSTETSIEKNTEKFLNDFKILIKEGNEVTIKNFLKFFVNSIQGELISKCYYHDKNYTNYIRCVCHSLILDLPYEKFQECDLNISIADTPVISCIWDHTRMINNLINIGKCNDNPFDGKVHKNNTHSILVMPLRIVIVTNGNHSINSAIVHGEGNLIIDKVVDISPLLKEYKFNGCDYINLKTNRKVNMIFLKNSSQPLLYSLGLLFEMSRILVENEKL